MFGIVIVWFLLAVAVGVAATTRGRSGFAWFLLAVIVSPLIAGVFVLALGNLNETIEREERARNSRPCPHCAELVLRKALVCRYCGSDLPEPPPKPVFEWHPQRLPGALVALAIIVGIFWLVMRKPSTETARIETPASTFTAVERAAEKLKPSSAQVSVPMPRPRPF